jgi:hypothetical protein
MHLAMKKRYKDNRVMGDIILPIGSRTWGTRWRWAKEALTAHSHGVPCVQRLDKARSLVHPARDSVSWCVGQPVAGLVADVPGVDAGAVPANAHVAVSATSTHTYVMHQPVWAIIRRQAVCWLCCGLADSADTPAHKPPAHSNKEC